MLRNTCKLLFISSLVFFFNAPSFAQNENADPMPSGIFSAKNMDIQAKNVKTECVENGFKARYLDCACMAGVARTKLENKAYQGRIWNELSRGIPKTMLSLDSFIKDAIRQKVIDLVYRDLSAGELGAECVDPVRTRKTHLNKCASYSSSFREHMAENEKFCECVTEAVAEPFILKPVFKSRYVNGLVQSAMTSCGAKFNKFL